MTRTASFPHDRTWMSPEKQSSWSRVPDFTATVVSVAPMPSITVRASGAKFSMVAWSPSSLVGGQQGRRFQEVDLALHHAREVIAKVEARRIGFNCTPRFGESVVDGGEIALEHPDRLWGEVVAILRPEALQLRHRGIIARGLGGEGRAARKGLRDCRR